MDTPVIVWFRLDLRLRDNPALSAAVRDGGAVLPVFIWSPPEEGKWAPGAASRWWLHHSLKSLDESLRKKGSRLLLRTGPALDALLELADETGTRAVYWNRRYEPVVIERDRRVAEGLERQGIRKHSFNGSLLFEPWEIQTRLKKPFQVFTPFWKACSELTETIPPPGLEPRDLNPPKRWPGSLELRRLGLEPAMDWAGGLKACWTPGEAGAERAFNAFSGGPIDGYGEARNLPAVEGTSRLSPHLHFGEISPRQIWHGLRRKPKGAASPADVATYLKEVGWRDFAYHLLFHFPHTTGRPMRPQWERFVWERDPVRLKAWQKGKTGYPVVDAGMRELWATGWMHNRVRMIVASFLIKDLLLSWKEGAGWFWDTLVDADLANNTLNWQWSAGCGADAAPFFRIFNPVTQGEKFDPKGGYVRRWVPELKGLPDQWIHRPWLAPEEVLAKAKVRLGRNYPMPVVDHAVARQEALKRFKGLRRQ